MNFLAVGCGGFAGAMLRYAIDLIPLQSYGFPCKTLFINVAGSFILGMLYGIASQKNLSPLLLLFLGTGLCGGFTTFSAFAVQTVSLIKTDAVLAILYVLFSILLGAGAVLFGGWLVRLI